MSRRCRGSRCRRPEGVVSGGSYRSGMERTTGVQAYYAESAERLGRVYESVSFESVHEGLLDLLPKAAARALGVGAGAGGGGGAGRRRGDGAARGGAGRARVHGRRGGAGGGAAGPGRAAASRQRGDLAGG